MGRNVRDKLHKKISKSQVERKKIVSYLHVYRDAFFAKINVS